MYVLSTGCQWRYVPKDLPPKSTLFGYFDLGTGTARWIGIHHALYVKCREDMDREASPTACVIDSQSVKARKKGRSIDRAAYDAGKKIKGKKRHILVDTLGLLLHAVVHPADIQDRDGGVLVLSTLFGLYPFCKSSLLMADIRAGLSKGFSQNPAASANRNRQTLRSGKRVRASAATLGCRTHFRLA